MKTTMDIADDLLRRAKAAAKSENRTLKSLTEEGLRLVLDRCAKPKRARIRPVVVHGKGPAPHLPTDFWENVRDYAYGDDAVDRD